MPVDDRGFAASIADFHVEGLARGEREAVGSVGLADAKDMSGPAIDLDNAPLDEQSGGYGCRCRRERHESGR